MGVRANLKEKPWTAPKVTFEIGPKPRRRRNDGIESQKDLIEGSRYDRAKFFWLAVRFDAGLPLLLSIFG